MASFAGPKPDAGDSPSMKRLKRIHLFIAVRWRFSFRCLSLPLLPSLHAHLEVGIDRVSPPQCASLISELLTVVIATITRNMLVETAVPATASLKALLLEGEYAWAWCGCNVHFLLGLFGFVSAVTLNAFISFGGSCCIGPALTCGVGSALLLMLSAVNRAVGAGSVRAGGSLLGLLGRYGSLLLAEVFVGKKVAVALALILGVAAAVLGATSVARQE